MKSEKVDLLVKALIKAKCAFGPVVKSRENPFFKSKYADLSAIEEAVRGALDLNGLCVVQTTEVLAAGSVLVTTLYHESGQWVSGQYPLNPVKNDPQGMGSAVTYGRRYALSALLGIVADEDDDGNAASHTSHKTESAKPAKSGELTATFVPVSVTSKEGEKNGKPWVMYSIKDPQGEYYSTFDEDIYHAANEAKQDGNEITLHYVMNGKYKNATAVAQGVAH